MSETNTAETLTDEQMSDAKPGLSEQEKAALAAEDDAGAGVSEGDSGAAADLPPDDAVVTESTDDAGAGTPEAAPAAETAADAPPEIPRGTAANVELLPTRDVDLNAAQARLAEIEAAQAELDAKFDEDDLDAKEYLSQSRALTQESSSISADVREAQFVQNANRSLASTDWQRSVNAFIDNNEQFASPIMQGALNAALNELYTDDANLGSSHNWFLQTAKRAVLEQISPHQAAQDNPSDAVAAAQSAANKSNAAKANLPRTLGDVPAADAQGTGKGKFDDLDGLDGVELEAKLALMTPEQEQEYLRSE